MGSLTIFFRIPSFRCRHGVGRMFPSVGTPGRRRPHKELPFLPSDVSHGDVVQQPKNAFVYFAERFADRALLRVVTLAVFRETRGQDDRTVDGPDHLKRCDRVRIASQPIAAVRSLLRPQETRSSQAAAESSTGAEAGSRMLRRCPSRWRSAPEPGAWPGVSGLSTRSPLSW